MARLKLEYSLVDSSGFVTSDIGANSFIVYPQGNVLFDDVTVDAGVNYNGDPYSAVSLDFGAPGDGKPDLFISMQTEDQSVFFENNSLEDGDIEFFNRTSDRFEITPPQFPYSGLVVGDFNNDGGEDMVVCSPDSPHLYRYSTALARFQEVSQDPTIFNADYRDSLKNSFCANWVDFNHDGLLDLFLGRALNGGNKPDPLEDVLFKQTEQGFVPVPDSGLTSHVGATLSCVWGDMDGNGLYDVVIADSHNQNGTKFYNQVSDTTFVEDPNAFPAEFVNSEVIGLQWLDFNKDNYLDLLAVRKTGDSFVLLNDGDSFDGVVTIPRYLLATVTGMSSVDFNLDGWPDLLSSRVKRVSAGTTYTDVRLDMNLAGTGFELGQLVETPNALGLTAPQSGARGMSVCDFNADGAPDVFLGRQPTHGNSAGLVFQNTQPGGSIGSWLKVKLVGSEDTKSSIGAFVSLKTVGGQPLGTQIVDGGSGRGSQQPRILTFGLGDLNEQVEVFVQWPSNPAHDQMVLVNPSYPSPHFNETVEVVENADLEIFSYSIQFQKILIPNTDLMNWEFTWKTNTLTDKTEDKVYLSGVTGCGQLPSVLEYGVEDVVIEDPSFKVTQNPVTTYFQHKLTLNNVPCNLGCMFSYRVRSCQVDMDCTGTEVPLKSGRIKFCPVSQ